MDFFTATILGIVQGLTEFLPVSSSGHLVLFQSWLTPGEHSLIFDLAVHLGTVLSVITIYRRSLSGVCTDIIKSIQTQSMTPGARLFMLVFLGSIPTAIIGFAFKDIFESLFNHLFYVGIAFFITGILLFMTRSKKSSNMESVNMADFGGIESLTVKRALFIGLTQGLAITPGISRSGTTISSAILIGVDRRTAALFSFMLSIPAILGASLLQALHIKQWSASLAAPLMVGLISAYISGLLGLWLVLKFVKKGRLELFSIYLWGLSLFILLRGLIA